MASAKQLKQQKAFAKKYAKKGKKKTGAKSKKSKSNPKRKTHTTYSKKQLEQRLKQLEQEVEYLKTAGFTNYNPTTMQSFGESKKEIKEISDELKREMRY